MIDSQHIFALLVLLVITMGISQQLWLAAGNQMGILLASFDMNTVPFYVMLSMMVIFGADWSWWQAADALSLGCGVLIAQSPAIKRRPRPPRL